MLMLPQKKESKIIYDEELYFTTSSATFVTAFSQTVKGAAKFQLSHEVSDIYWELTIDGVMIVNDQIAVDNATYGVSGVWEIEWKRSVLIRIREAGGTDDAFIIGSWTNRGDIGRIYDKPFTFSTTSATLVTALELAGRGSIQFQVLNEALTTTNMQVTIDGKVIIADRQIIGTTLGGVSGVWRFDWRRSIKIELREGGASNAIAHGFYWLR